MHIQLSAPTRYLQAPHEIIRHRRLTGTAKSLLLWALSLRPTTEETLQSIGTQMAEGKMAFSRARKQLIDEGYVLVRRENTAGGHWFTRILVSSVPLLETAAVESAWAAALDRAPEGGMPTAGNPGTREVGSSPERENTGKNTTHPAAPAEAVEPPQPPEPSEPPEFADAARTLVRISGEDRRVRLGLVEALKLAPLVVQWRTHGGTEADLRTALLAGLPPQVFSASALLRRRLEAKMPPPPTPRAAAPPRHECELCRAPVPVAGRCPGCAGQLAPPERGVWAAVTERGVAAARSAMRRPPGEPPGRPAFA